MIINSKRICISVVVLAFVGFFIGTTYSQTNATRTFNRGNWDRPLACQSSIDINVAAATTTELVALQAGQTIQVCSFIVSGTGAAVGSVQFQSGTGTNCGTGTADISGVMSLTQDTPMALGSGVGKIFSSPLAEALCITTATASFTADGVLSYTQF